MSIVIQVDVVCDYRDCGDVYQELGSVASCRASAKKAGWTFRVVGGKRYDVCAEHALVSGPFQIADNGWAIENPDHDAVSED